MLSKIIGEGAALHKAATLIAYARGAFVLLQLLCKVQVSLLLALGIGLDLGELGGQIRHDGIVLDLRDNSHPKEEKSLHIGCLINFHVILFVRCGAAIRSSRVRYPSRSDVMSFSLESAYDLAQLRRSEQR